MLLPLINAAIYFGLAIGIGAAVVRFGLLPRCELAHSERVPPLRTAATAAAFAAAIVLVAAPFRLLLQVSLLADPGEAWLPLLQTIIVDTALGRAMQLQAIWAAAALMAFTVARVGRDRGWKAAAIGMVILAATPGLAGHAAAAERPMIALTVATLHVLAAGAWVGTLFHLWRATRSVSESTVTSMLRAFHPVALGSAGLLAATGAYQAWIALGGLGDLASSVWGRLLVAKVVAVVVIAALGHRHWKTAEARLARGERKGLADSFLRELKFAALVIVFTAFLASSAPPL